MNAYNEARIRVGCFAALSGAVFVGFLFWISGGDPGGIFGRDRDTYVVPFSDVTGLRAQAPVTVAGKTVGEVTNTRLLAGQSSSAEVVMEIDRGVQIWSNARFVLVRPAIIGTPYITVEPGTPGGGATLVSSAPDDPPELAARKKPARESFTLTSSDSGSGINKVMSESQVLVSTLNEVLRGFHEHEAELLGHVNSVLKSSAELMGKINNSLDAQRLQEMLDNVTTLTSELRGLVADNRERFGQLMEDVNSVVRTTGEQVEARGEDVGKLLKSVGTTLDAQLQPLLEALTRLTRSLDEAVADNAHSLRETMRSVRAATDNLAGFTARIKANPSLLIFGDDESKLTREQAQARLNDDLRERGRLPIYGKRE